MTIHAEYPTPKGARMNAIEDLRSTANNLLTEDGISIIDGIADRIAHEYMELPKDADGVPCVWGDDVLREDCRPEEHGPVKGWQKDSVGRWYIHVTGTDHERTWLACECHHVKPDSWEQIEEDAKGWYAADYWHVRGKQTNDGMQMEQDMRIDLVARAKALAGVEQ